MVLVALIFLAVAVFVRRQAWRAFTLLLVVALYDTATVAPVNIWLALGLALMWWVALVLAAFSPRRGEVLAWAVAVAMAITAFGAQVVDVAGKVQGMSM